MTGMAFAPRGRNGLAMLRDFDHIPVWYADTPACVWSRVNRCSVLWYSSVHGFISSGIGHAGLDQLQRAGFHLAGRTGHGVAGPELVICAPGSALARFMGTSRQGRR